MFSTSNSRESCRICSGSSSQTTVCETVAAAGHERVLSKHTYRHRAERYYTELRMSHMKVLCVIGTRPEAIKMAPVVQELRKHPTQIATVVCVTAQHRELLDSALALFDIVPDYDLDIMQDNQGLADLTARLLTGLTPNIRERTARLAARPGRYNDRYGRSASGLLRRCPVGHVEADCAPVTAASLSPKRSIARLPTASATYISCRPSGSPKPSAGRLR